MTTANESRNLRACPVCGSDPARAQDFMAERIDAAKLTSLSFASRKTPEFMNHHLVRCPDCDLVYADCPPNEQSLAEAYHDAAYDSAEEANDAATAYAEAIAPLLARLPARHSALEIGTGTGVFLEHLERAGFRELVGVEPSLAALAAAEPHRRQWLRAGVFREQDFEPGSFDLVCCFMTMEHVRDPRLIAEAALRLLRPGGAFVTVTHDYRAWVNRLLGRRSPIIDIEHMQLFSRGSIAALLAGSGYTGVVARAFPNRYACRYWLRLLPLPEPVKAAGLKLLAATGTAQRRVSLNVGNTIAAGYKPCA